MRILLIMAGVLSASLGQADCVTQSKTYAELKYCRDVEAWNFLTPAQRQKHIDDTQAYITRMKRDTERMERESKEETRKWNAYMDKLREADKQDRERYVRKVEKEVWGDEADGSIGQIK